MKKILLLILIVPIILTGCSIDDFFGGDDPNFPAEVDKVIYDVDQIEETQETDDENTAMDENTAAVKKMDEEEDAEDETNLEELFTGNWWLYMQYDDFRSEGEMQMLGGEADEEKYSGAMTAVSGLVHDFDGSTTETTPTGERVSIDVDNTDISIASESGTSMSGNLTVGDSESSATGTFTSALGDGTWYLSNTQTSTWPEF